MSIHYQPLAADPVLEPKWMNREGEYGRVRVWDTESWVANSDDRVAAVIASMRAMGQDRTAGIYAGNVFTSEKPRINGKEYAVAQVWPAGASVAACQHFIGEREFKIMRPPFAVECRSWAGSNFYGLARSGATSRILSAVWTNAAKDTTSIFFMT